MTDENTLSILATIIDTLTKRVMEHSDEIRTENTRLKLALDEQRETSAKLYSLALWGVGVPLETLSPPPTEKDRQDLLSAASSLGAFVEENDE